MKGDLIKHWQKTGTTKKYWQKNDQFKLDRRFQHRKLFFTGRKIKKIKSGAPADQVQLRGNK